MEKWQTPLLEEAPTSNSNPDFKKNMKTVSSSYLSEFGHIMDPEQRKKAQVERTTRRMAEFQNKINKSGWFKSLWHYLSAWIMIHRLQLQLFFFLICALLCIYALWRRELAQLIHTDENGNNEVYRKFRFFGCEDISDVPWSEVYPCIAELGKNHTMFKFSCERSGCTTYSNKSCKDYLDGKTHQYSNKTGKPCWESKSTIVRTSLLVFSALIITLFHCIIIFFISVFRWCQCNHFLIHRRFSYGIAIENAIKLTVFIFNVIVCYYFLVIDAINPFNPYNLPFTIDKKKWGVSYMILLCITFIAYFVVWPLKFILIKYYQDPFTDLNNVKFFNLYAFYINYGQTFIPSCWRHCCGRRLEFYMWKIDVDDFKNFNNLFNDHAYGDLALNYLGGVLSKVRDVYHYNMNICRTGGDEFAVIGTWQSEALLVETIEKVQSLLRKFYLTTPDGRTTLRLTLSIGICKKSDSLDFGDWSEKAEKASYFVKKTTKNSWKFYSEEVENYHAQLDSSRMMAQMSKQASPARRKSRPDVSVKLLSPDFTSPSVQDASPEGIHHGTIVEPDEISFASV